MDVAKSLVQAFVCSRVDYCNGTLVDWTARTTKALQLLMNAAARLVTKRRKFDHISNAIRNELHWLPVVQGIEYNLCLLTCKCIHDMAPRY